MASCKKLQTSAYIECIEKTTPTPRWEEGRGEGRGEGEETKLAGTLLASVIIVYKTQVMHWKALRRRMEDDVHEVGQKGVVAFLVGFLPTYSCCTATAIHRGGA